MLLTLIDQIRSRTDEAEFEVWSYSKDDQSKVGAISHSEPNGIHACFQLAYSKKTIFLIALQCILILFPYRVFFVWMSRFPYLNSIRKADAVIDISGFALTGNRPFWRHLVYLAEARTIRASGTPFYVMTQSFGPFETFIQRFISSEALKSADFISARGPRSAQHLEKLGMLLGQDFHVSPDMTYLFERSSSGLDADICALLKQPRLAIVPNVNVYRQAAANDHSVDGENAYVEVMRDLCRSAALDHGCQLIFIPHESDSSRVDDLDLISMIQADEFILRNSIKLDRRLPASEIKFLISDCDGVIASRYHAMLAALSTGVPVFVLGWADKYQESAEMAGNSKFVFCFNDFDRQTSKAKFAEFWNVRKMVRADLLKNLEKNKLVANSTFDLLVSCINKQP